MTTILPFQQLTDYDVITKVLEGNIALFEVLIRRYNPYLYKIGRSYGYGHEDVEDLMQEAFIHAYQNLQRFENRSSFKTWLIRIMLNECYRKAHKFSTTREIATELFLSEKTTPMFSSNSTNDPEKMIKNKELNWVIEKAIMQIPMDYRMVFSLREISGLSVQETAKALNLTETNVKVRLNRAKSMLRKEVEKMYSSEEIFQFNLIYCDKIVTAIMEKISRLG